ncbi:MULTISPECIES: ribonuclease E/G [unclassified Rhizobium]|uniref:Rne/Rng family ribonuclease n=1 Tax=unclassified Rhizobium TaxID=2613769 RepID=UPI0006F73D6C|nr:MULTISPECIES: ribonuclease E/G [unclassified Rhizobium]KQV34394.1 ribonuclease [Rhizobium sp. Root1212]KRD23772.1 ribonuclease [Rhizobium sp. Root268]
MAEKMLIDASHAEETRVVVVRGNRIEEFDFESEHKKQIRGNIYLAKVTRVEPSLQAAFVDYGGNRHGFLAFAEIHPDYYQIPLADRQALLRAEAEEARRGDDDIEPVETAPYIAASETVAEEAEVTEIVEETSEVETVTEAAAEEIVEEKPKKVRRPRRTKKAAAEAEEAEVAKAEGEDDTGEMAAMVDTDSISEDVRGGRRHDDDDDDDHHEEKEVIESVGAEDAMEEVPDRQSNRRPRKQYRIQEVIKRRQILLVQVAKEERGNKGAALTTYLSLAGRYSVLMPNTARGGGISRKITNLPDRKRLKEIARALEVPQGMGVILRTAGANRTKVEIKRDFEYLMRLWENVRTLTLASTAPCLVYEEGSLIKRSIRDLYNKDISEIVVAGEEGYKEAKGFMKMLMPSHAKVVQPYRDVHPIFSRSGIEAQLDRMLQPQVTLKSGGYIIINQTEALVAIDVNSGRSTREHSIEDTALQTNLEAAEEVARQLRLRDLAGLVVVDFIDMEEKRNNRSVEKRLKDHLKNDRARIQVGRISHFGLLEMSRQRIRASVLESTMQVCSHCNGTGHVRSQSSVALHVLRGVEEYLLKNTTHDITVRTTPDIALYLLNHKRSTIIDYEARFGVSIIIEADAHVGAQHFAIDRGEPVENPVKIEQIMHFEPEIEEDDDDVIIEEEIDEEEEVVVEAKPERAERAERSEGDNDRKRKRRRRRRGGRGNGEQTQAEAAGDDDAEAEGDDEDGDDAADTVAAGDASEEDRQKRKRRRRGKRGGRRSRGDEVAGEEASGEASESDNEEATENLTAEAVVDDATEPAAAEMVAAEVAVEETKPAKPRRSRKKAAPAGEEAPVTEEAVAEAAVVDSAAQAAIEETPAEETPVEPAVEEAAATLDEKSSRGNRDLNTIASAPVVRSSAPAEGEGDNEPPKPKKGGWWQKRGFF